MLQSWEGFLEAQWWVAHWEEDEGLAPQQRRRESGMSGLLKQGASNLLLQPCSRGYRQLAVLSGAALTT